MPKLLTVIGVGLVGLMAPALLAAAALATIGNAAAGATGSSLVSEMQAFGYENGRLPAVALEVVSTHGAYECRVATTGGAAEAWMALVEAATADGLEIEGGGCYRSYDEQLAVWRARRCFIPGNCDGDPFPPTAEPGTSVHGWGLAIDVWGRGDVTLGCLSGEFLWMQINAPTFGWVHPIWAQCGKDSAEPWHWEYRGLIESVEPDGSEIPS
jgi:hypothetical protein